MHTFLILCSVLTNHLTNMFQPFCTEATNTTSTVTLMPTLISSMLSTLPLK
uniref:Uncharacterized protein n=1 Tax=Setaria viridis TaxID=4556 RepID=A0A4U6W7U2_SETVI|nr:hypothetical protein SEVIR_1G135750v2 [Setaria viridis]